MINSLGRVSFTGGTQNKNAKASPEIKFRTTAEAKETIIRDSTANVMRNILNKLKNVKKK